MIRYPSPLRYPGGKTKIAPFLEQLIQESGCHDGRYIEPYAGGAGAGLSLLFREVVSSIQINDASFAVYAFWKAITQKTDEFCEWINTVRLDIDEWHSQRAILLSEDIENWFALGFAAFYLNRTNRSGIIRSGGIIGGLEQDGQWKMDARFNREALVRRVKRVGLYRDRIEVTRKDALDVLRDGNDGGRCFIYLDPPYYNQADRLYDQWYDHDDHARVAAAVSQLQCSWVVSYDDCTEVRQLYERHSALKLTLQYSAARSYEGAEVLFMNQRLASVARRDLLPGTA